MFNKVISILGTLILLVLAGCRDVAPISVEEPSTENRTITLNLDITTRADYLLPDNPEPDIIRLWICDMNDKIITSIVSSNNVWTPVGKTDEEGNEIDIRTTLQTEIEADDINKDSSFKIYLVLNQPFENSTTPTPVDFMNVTSIDKLKQKTFVLTEYWGDNKVPMTGEGTAKFLSVEGNKIIFDASINATRCVAKLELYCTKRTSSSKLIIKSFTLNNVPDKGYLFTPVDNDIIDYKENRDLLSGNSGGVTIATSYTTELPTDIESVKSSFTKIDFDNPYLLENTYGDGQFVTEIVNPGMRYNLTVKYNFNGSDYEQTIYLPKIERNTWYKLYMRMKEIELDTYCQINSWTEHEMEVPAFE